MTMFRITCTTETCFDVDVEADSYEEAFEKARPIAESKAIEGPHKDTQDLHLRLEWPPVDIDDPEEVRTP